MDSSTPPEVSESGCAPEDYTIGWICMHFKEQTAAIMMLDKRHPDIKKQNNDPNTYNLGSIESHNVVIACLPPGCSDTNDNTIAIIAVWMTSTFPSIRLCLIVGMGSGIPSRVRLGDVVVGTPDGEFPAVVEWEDGEGIDGKSSPSPILLSALTKLRSNQEIEGSKMQKYLETFKKHNRLASTYLVSEELKDPLFEKDEDKTVKEEDTDSVATYTSNTREAEIHHGLIASTSFLIEDITIRERLDLKLGSRRLLCIDTVASRLVIKFPCMVIRGICDYAGEGRDAYKGWEGPAAAVAAAFAKEVLCVLPGCQVAGLPTIKSKGTSAF
ncbi:nucleoside phosphorylase domain-containing protein [Nemania abortiva]|nr:nucleoside phosphorylase domain-containing protein [Nemania abortiva]